MDNGLIMEKIFIFVLIISHIYFFIRSKKILDKNIQMNNAELSRLQILTDVLLSNFENRQEQLDYVLHEALKLTESQYGYIYLYDEEKCEFTLNSWTLGVMGDCDIVDKLTKYQLVDTGIWGEVVRQRKPIIVNDFQEFNQLKKGYPQGHVELENFMTIPVLMDEKIVAVVGLGNKKGDYKDNDVYQLTLLMNGVWNAVERREVMENLKHKSFHDPLTDLYNRRFVEEELIRLDTERNLPLSIIVGDVNGLKLTNDVFGHALGDELLKKIAKVLKRVCRADEIIGRIGGDEFTILLPKTSYEDAEKLIDRIRIELSKERVKFVQCSLSMGAWTKTDKYHLMGEVKEKAEERMYFMKSTEKKAVQKKTVDAMIEKLHETEKEYKHSVDVSNLCGLIGKELRMADKEIQNLKRAAYLHDIGKVALEPGRLDPNYKENRREKDYMTRHAVLGYRILNSIDTLNEFAEAVLFHHEHWDGTGYPKGLKGEEIPLYSRIIYLADHYFEYTQGRGESLPLGKEEALNKIKEDSGTKFDPQLVEILSRMTEDDNAKI